MQQFLLFFTMLIVASEAFPQYLHGSPISKSIRRRTSRFANRLVPPNRDRYMFRRVRFPLFSPPPVYDSPDYEEAFVVPPRRRSRFHPPKRRKNHPLRKSRRFTNRKRSRRKYSRRRGWTPPGGASFDVVAPFESPKGVDSVWPSPDLRGFFPDFRLAARNPYIVYLYPVFIHPRKRRVDFLKKDNLRRQDLSSLRNKNKRSAGNGTVDVSLDGSEWKNNGNISRDDGNVTRTSIEAPPVQVHPIRSADSVSESSKMMDTNRESDNLRYNNYRRDYFDFYNPYPVMTLPPVKLPTVTFRYPYDRSLYESPFRPNLKYQTEAPQREKSSEENCKRQADGGPHRELGKLREMLQEVELMLGKEGDEEKVDDFKCDDGEKTGSKDKKDETTEANGEPSKTNETISLKEKIDCIAIPILTQISERLGKMTNTTSSQCNASFAEFFKPKSKAANYRCSADGIWKSSVLGVYFILTTMPNMMLKVQISAANDAIINKKWSIQGLTLSRRGGPLMLAAIYPQKRKIASFIGQCKTCQDQDLIFGSWTVFSYVRKFTDLWSSMETKLDILKNWYQNAGEESVKDEKRKKLEVKLEPKSPSKKSKKKSKKS